MSQQPGYDQAEVDRFTADAEQNYKGRCPANLYPVTVSGIKGGTWVETSQPKCPPADSFNFLQEHDVEIEYEQDGRKTTLHKYNGAFVGGVPFIDDCPVATEEPFRCRARARWGMQDAHPENRGFMALPGYDGRTYYGNWSAWSEWYSFPTPEEQARREKEAADAAAREKATREHNARVKAREEREAKAKKEKHDKRTAFVEEIKAHPYYRPDADLEEEGQFYEHAEYRLEQLRVIEATGQTRRAKWQSLDDVKAYIAEIPAREKHRAQKEQEAKEHAERAAKQEIEDRKVEIRAHYLFKDGGQARIDLLKQALEAPQESYHAAARQIAEEEGIEL